MSIVRYCFDASRGVRVCVCDKVYEPAEDTWLAVRLIDSLKGASWKPSIVIDIGAGTGILGVYAARSLGARLTLLVDINSHACSCSSITSRESGLDAVVDVACCDNITCIACSYVEESLLIYNTPYLPVRDSGVEGLAWSGGLSEALRIVQAVKPCPPRCLILVYSSLSGDDKPLLRLLALEGYNITRRREHYFFEDIIGVLACRER